MPHGRSNTCLNRNWREQVRARCGSSRPRSSKSKGKLKFYKPYKGPVAPVQLTYVYNGVYEGGSNDYYKVYTGNDLLWALHIDFVMKYHRIPLGR
jgi:hypothetical protein